MGALRLVSAAALALLALAGPAGAATPRFLGQGHDPGVAVDRAGTAHVAWLAETGEGAAAAGTLEYCQVPHGKRSCAVRLSFPLERPGTGKAQVVTHRGAVYLLAPVGNASSVLFASADGGRTFAPHPIGDMPAIAVMLYGPGDALSILSGSGPASYGRFGTDGSGPGTLPVTFGEATESLDTALTAHDGRLAAFLSGSQGIRSVLWSGSGDPNAQETWAEGPSLRGLRSSPAAATGRSGTYLAYVDRQGARSAIRVRRLKGSRLRAARRVSGQDPTELALAEAPGGHLALVWPGTDDGWIARSRTGRRWTRPRRLFRGNTPGDIHIALGRRGGWAVWDGSPGNEGTFPIRIAAMPR